MERWGRRGESAKEAGEFKRYEEENVERRDSKGEGRLRVNYTYVLVPLGIDEYKNHVKEAQLSYVIDSMLIPEKLRQVWRLADLNVLGVLIRRLYLYTLVNMSLDISDSEMFSWDC